jgi:hypothetical protein
MRHPFLTVASAALITLTAPCIVAAQQASTSRPSVLDSLSTRLVELELERVSAAAVISPQTRPPRDFNSQIAMLHEQLRALPEGAAADREANRRVLLALDARAATVQAKIRDARQFYTDAHPAVRELQSEQRAIDDRRSDIRRTI